MPRIKPSASSSHNDDAAMQKQKAKAADAMYAAAIKRNNYVSKTTKKNPAATLTADEFRGSPPPSYSYQDIGKIPSEAASVSSYAPSKGGSNTTMFSVGWGSQKPKRHSPGGSQIDRSDPATATSTPSDTAAGKTSFFKNPMQWWNSSTILNKEQRGIPVSGPLSVPDVEDSEETEVDSYRDFQMAYNNLEVQEVARPWSPKPNFRKSEDFVDERKKAEAKKEEKSSCCSIL